MKLSNLINAGLFALIISLAGLGCKTRSVGVTPLSSNGTGSGSMKGPQDVAPGNSVPTDQNKIASSPADVASTGLENPDVRHGWPRDREIFKSDTVHFDYDSSAIKSDEKAKVAAVADYIKSHPMDALEIEGHCDVRGTEEYNRALGERRALALREELIRLGVEPSRIDTVSYGEDHPVDTGHDEAAYRKNRRGEFLLEKHQTLAGLTGSVNNATQ